MSALTNFSNSLASAKDPALLGYPPTLPLAVALGEGTTKEICEDYGVSRQQWRDLCDNPVFRNAVDGFLTELQKDGMSFKLKARMQAEGMLNKSWQMVHDKTGDVPPSVKADLIKFTVRCAGLSDEKKDAPGAGGIGTALQINIILD